MVDENFSIIFVEFGFKASSGKWNSFWNTRFVINNTNLFKMDGTVYLVLVSEHTLRTQGQLSLS